jgi:hypothetical protein
MNYQLAIQRGIDKDITHCVHGLTKELCGFCNGIISVKKVRRTSAISSDLLDKYEEIKARCKNFQEDWTEDEFFVVYSNLKDVLKTKTELSAIYKTAIELGRTLNAVRWAKEHIFSKKEYHRGQVVIAFRKLFEIEC